MSPRPWALLVAVGCARHAPAPVPATPAPECRSGAAADGPWFTEITDAIGLGATDAATPPVATSIVAADVDEDGWTDLFAAVFPSQREPAGSPSRTRFLFLSRPGPDGGRVFEDTLDASGLLDTDDGEGGRGITTVSFADLDNDGHLDAIGCPAEISTLFVDGCAAFLGHGDGTFERVRGGELSRDLFSVPSSAVLDYDLDGVLDFWPATIGRWQYGPAAVSVPRLYRGRGDGTFTEVGGEVGLPREASTGTNYRANFGITSCDVDEDGDRDVLVANYGVPIGPNALFRNDGGTFVDVAAELGVDRGDLGGFTFSMACDDLDDDGDRDLVTSEVAHPGQGTDPSAVLLGALGPDGALAPFERLDDADIGTARAPGDLEGDNLALVGDVDLDGRRDLLVLASNYPQQASTDTEYTHPWLFRQRDGDGLGFEDRTADTPWGRPRHQTLEGGALVDLDGDGDLDLVTGTGLFNSGYIATTYGTTTAAIRAYRNDAGNDANVLRVRAVGRGEGGANTSGIGAVVEVTAGGRTQRREVLGSWGHSNTQEDVWLTFGLGAACTAERVEVRWPDAEGAVTTRTDVPANVPLVVRQEDVAR